MSIKTAKGYVLIEEAELLEWHIDGVDPKKIWFTAVLDKNDPAIDKLEDQIEDLEQGIYNDFEVIGLSYKYKDNFKKYEYPEGTGFINASIICDGINGYKDVCWYGKHFQKASKLKIKMKFILCDGLKGLTIHPRIKEIKIVKSK